CLACQQSLERLLDGPPGDSATDLPMPPAGRPAAEPLEPFLRALQDTPPPATQDDTEPESGGGSAEIRFPDPPTPRGPLGCLESYHIQEELGRGAFGIVFKAYDEGLDRTVALKVLKPELAASPSDRARFQGDARKAAAVHHDHVVTIYRVGSTRDF